MRSDYGICCIENSNLLILTTSRTMLFCCAWSIYGHVARLYSIEVVTPKHVLHI